jgi:hypothetical protein
MGLPVFEKSPQLTAKQDNGDWDSAHYIWGVSGVQATTGSVSSPSQQTRGGPQKVRTKVFSSARCVAARTTGGAQALSIVGLLFAHQH